MIIALQGKRDIMGKLVFGKNGQVHFNNENEKQEAIEYLLTSDNVDLVQRGKNVKIKLENQKFNTCLETSDWRYSAAINGLVEYFQYYEKDNVEYEIKNDCLFYNEVDKK